MDLPRGPRWTDVDRDLTCDSCLYPLDDCRCVCPFCRESAGCLCTIGIGVATGG